MNERPLVLRIRDRLVYAVASPGARKTVPVFAEQALATLASMLGTFLIAGVGQAAIAGVGLVDSLNFLFMNIATNIALGVTALVAQAVGRGSPHEAGEMASQSLVLSFYVGILLAVPMVAFSRPLLEFMFGGAEREVIHNAQEFMMYSMGSLPLLSAFSVLSGIRRGEGDNFSPLLGSLASNILYVAVALVCIHGLHMDVAGIGWGLMVSRAGAACVVGWFVFTRPNRVVLPRLSPRLSFKRLKPMLSISLPSAADTLMFNGGKIFVKVFMSGMGTAALAADSIANVLTSFLQFPGRVYSVTAVPATGRAFGTGDMLHTRSTMIRQTLYSCVADLAMTAVFFIMLSPLIGLFTQDPQTVSYTTGLMLLMLGTTAIFWPPSFVTPSALRATGDAGYTMWVSLTSMFVLRVFGSWFLGVYLNMNVMGVWLSMVADWVARGIFFAIRVYSMSWKKHYRPTLFEAAQAAEADK